MEREELFEKIFASDQLPTLPNVASKLVILTGQDDSTITDIANLITQDISLSSKILKVVNSAFYGLPQQIASIKQAVSILGVHAVRSLILSFSFLNMRDGKNDGAFDFEKFWESSLAAGVAQKLILEKVPGANTDEVFLSGLLQNLGELILIRTLPDEYKQILAEAEDDQESLREKEIETFGASHTEIGYEAAKRWGFPDTLLLPILYHHNPTQHTSEDKTLQQLIHATYLSDLLTSIIYNPRPGEYHERFMKEAEELLDLDPEAIDDILAEVNQEVAQAGEYFGLKIKHTKSIKEILQEANISLSLMNLDYDQMNKQLVQAKLELEKLTEELQEKNRVLDNLANCDGLTGAFNHRYFQNSLDAEINKAKRHNRALSLIIMDIDDFKKFNDTYGHQTGDFVLKNFCKIIKENLREYDMLARYGGEEFAVILSDSDVGDGLKVGGKLRKAIDETMFEENGKKYHVTASFGLASARPANEKDFRKSGFIGKADQALYEAKRNGKNRIETLSPTPKPPTKKSFNPFKH